MLPTMATPLAPSSPMPSVVLSLTALPTFAAMAVALAFVFVLLLG
jgi:hypothetical protein